MVENNKTCENKELVGWDELSELRETGNLRPTTKHTLMTLNGEGNGDPLHYSCLENSMDRGAWWAAVPGVAQSRTRLSDWATSLFTFMHWRRKWQPTPVFLPGESQGQEPGGLPSMGSHRVGHDWSDLAAAAWRYKTLDFPGGSVVENPPVNAGDKRLIPALERAHMLQSSRAHVPELLKPEHPGAHDPQHETPLQWKACSPQSENSPFALKLERKPTQKQRPSSAKNK